MTDLPSSEGRVLGIDYGTHRVGLALSDELRITAQPLEVVARAVAVKRIAAIVVEMNVSEIVMGLPVGLSGKEGPAAFEARLMGDEVAKVTGLAVTFADERFTTSTAERAMLAANVRRSRRRETVDKVAAAVILQSFLDRLR